ncbi:uncharacterized protein TrAtP1_009226 [Trichoderma atroviride]|uniref:uncharacterized protein n=1 Tax=Hypocrea atroviridis TaxID=63577 RepID=UPI0033230916|nr:hypothetical protein TrAtP1_009226 [Trichoderma atroviride]
MKRKACQTSIDIHPASAPEGMTADRVEIIKRKQLSIQQMREASAAILADGARGPGNSLLDVEDMQSSTRVDSMALLGTKARDKYYRNDSPVEVVSTTASLQRAKSWGCTY